MDVEEEEVIWWDLCGLEDPNHLLWGKTNWETLLDKEKHCIVINACSPDAFLVALCFPPIGLFDPRYHSYSVRILWHLLWLSSEWGRAVEGHRLWQRVRKTVRWVSKMASHFGKLLIIICTLWTKLNAPPTMLHFEAASWTIRLRLWVVRRRLLNLYL